MYFEWHCQFVLFFLDMSINLEIDLRKEIIKYTQL